MVGYDFEIAGEDFPDYKCPICSLLLRHAIILSCGHSACKDCLLKPGVEDHEINSNPDEIKCPSCQKFHKKDEVEKRIEGQFLDRLITSSLQVKCKRHLEGCDWTGTISEYERHAIECGPTEIICPHCAAHLNSSEIEMHIANECLLVEIDCPFQEMGCTQTVLRKDVEAHVGNYTHTSYLVKFTLNFSNEVKTLRETNEQLLTELEALKETLSFKIAELEEKIRNQDDKLLVVNSKIVDFHNQHNENVGKLSGHCTVIDEKLEFLKENLVERTKDDGLLLKVNSSNVASLSEEEKTKEWSFKEMSSLIERNENNKFEAIMSLKPELVLYHDKGNSSLLHEACKHNNIACIDVLVKNGLQLDGENIFGYKAIHYAASSGFMDAARALLSIDESLLNCVNGKNQMSLLHFAAVNLKVEFVKFLLTQPGIQVDLKDYRNKMADEYSDTSRQYQRIRQMIREHRIKPA